MFRTSLSAGAAPRFALALGFMAAAASPGHAADFIEPHVFASHDGELDLLAIAMPAPVPSIAFAASSGTLHPTGWVYEICPRTAARAGNTCPSGAPTVAAYGGVRLALHQGDTLRIRLVNRLPALDPVKVTHSTDPGGANLPLNLTNLHTHGLIVPARAPTRSDPTFGDYVFTEIYNPANGTPVPQTTHQHGSIVRDYADYKIRIPFNHPSGAFWFHPHVHGLALNQLSSGLSGIISIGEAGDYARGDLFGTRLPETHVRHLILKDMQVVSAGTVNFRNGAATVTDGEVLNQEDPTFCPQHRASPSEARQGSCPGADTSASGNTYTGGRWFFTVSGQPYPTIAVTEPDGQLWRLTNASGSASYDLQLVDDTSGKPMPVQLISVDGVSINVPQATSPEAMAKLLGPRFHVAPCPSAPSRLGRAPVCVDQFAMMPSSRVEVWVTYRDGNGRTMASPKGATATFKTIGLSTGPAGDSWPEVDLAHVTFAQDRPSWLAAFALDVAGDALITNLPTGIFAAPVPDARPAPLPAHCKALAPGHRRRIFFGLVDPVNNPNGFGLGYEEVDHRGAVVPGTPVPVSGFDPAGNTICLPLGPGQTPARETWELVNLATENHNFHVHQTKFRFVGAHDAADGGIHARWHHAGILEDNAPLPIASPNIPDVAASQNGYCTMDQWHSGQCTSPPMVAEIPFSQLGEFVFHCHILEHEDGGMMAKIQVVAAPE